MEELQTCVVKNNEGVAIQLPPGFRFKPNDEALLRGYLIPKALSLRPASSAIPEQPVDVFHTPPYELPGALDEKRYFYSKLKKQDLGLDCFNTTCCGYWKRILDDEVEKVILARGSNTPIGSKRSLVFHLGQQRTQWVMDVYRLTPPPQSIPNSREEEEEEEWVVCCIYRQKESEAETGQLLTSWFNINGSRGDC